MSTETPVTAAVEFWRQQMELHKARADRAEAELSESKVAARKFRNQAHTWKNLYDGLLEKVARKLDVKSGP